MHLLHSSPSALAVLRHARVLARRSPQPDLGACLAQAAEALGAPADAELQASAALDRALGADDPDRAFGAAIDRETAWRLDLDAWLADQRHRRT